MTALTEFEKQELMDNGIQDNSFGRMFYDELRKAGYNHKDSIRIWINGVNNLKSESLNKTQIDLLKKLLTYGSGQWK